MTYASTIREPDGDKSYLALLDPGPSVVPTQTQTSLTLEVVQQASVAHQLRHNVDGLLQRAHSIQLDQLGVPQALHDLGLSQEVGSVHGFCRDGGNPSTSHLCSTESH